MEKLYDFVLVFNSLGIVMAFVKQFGMLDRVESFLYDFVSFCVE